MKILTIKRVSYRTDGTFGVLMEGDRPFCLTAELPWNDNRPEISCIPALNYPCKRVQSPKFGETFQVMNVPNRDHILFHKGNDPDQDSKGCIILGEQFAVWNDGSTAVLHSGDAFTEFMEMMEGVDEFWLTVT